MMTSKFTLNLKIIKNAKTRIHVFHSAHNEVNMTEHKYRIPASKHFKKSFRIHYKLVMNNPLLLMKKLVMKRRDFRYEFLTSIHYESLIKNSYRIRNEQTL